MSRHRRQQRKRARWNREREAYGEFLIEGMEKLQRAFKAYHSGVAAITAEYHARVAMRQAAEDARAVDG
jgi:hypothetical protein